MFRNQSGDVFTVTTSERVLTKGPRFWERLDGDGWVNLLSGVMFGCLLIFVVLPGIDLTAPYWYFLVIFSAVLAFVAIGGFIWGSFSWRDLIWVLDRQRQTLTRTQTNLWRTRIEVVPLASLGPAVSQVAPGPAGEDPNYGVGFRNAEWKPAWVTVSDDDADYLVTIINRFLTRSD